MTFRVLDILFCVHDGQITSLPATELFAYLFFFPTLLSGPVNRFPEFLSDLEDRKPAAETAADLAAISASS